MKMKKTTVYFAISLWCGVLSAQTQYSSEWYIQGGIGGAMLKYTCNCPDNPDFTINDEMKGSVLKYTFGQSSVSSRSGANFGFGYRYFFSRYFGFSSGADVSIYRSSLTVNDWITEYPIQTPSGLGGTFLFRGYYSGIKEKQKAVYLQLPLMLNVQVGLGEAALFYLGAGGKIGFPLSATSAQTVQSLTTKGYSDYTDMVYENLPQHGFDTYSGVVSSDKLSFGISVMLSFEGGLKWKISNGKNAIYTGVYMDYGLNNIQKETIEKSLLDYASSSDFHYNSVLQSGVVKDIRPSAIGFRLRFAFGSGKALSGSKHEEIPPPMWGYNF
jgi:hypothetical protein